MCVYVHMFSVHTILSTVCHIVKSSVNSIKNYELTITVIVKVLFYKLHLLYGYDMATVIALRPAATLFHSLNDPYVVHSNSNNSHYRHRRRHHLQL